jgi:hypothetical protein
MPHHSKRSQKLETPKGEQTVNPAAESSLRHGTQDTSDARAKNSGHGKKTADKWNQ